MDQITELEQEIDNWKNEFRKLNGREPSLADIMENETIQERRSQLKALIRENAPKNEEGGCTYFIERRRRYCARRATFGTDFCSSHGEAVEPSRLPTSVVEVTDQKGRKHNLKRPPKRMLNPFFIRDVHETPDWSRIFTDVSRPLLLDIGCAKGGYIEQLRNSCRQGASPWKEMWNFVGVELYPTLVEAANKAEAERGHLEKDLYYIGTNINISLEALELPNLQRVTFMFPDPWSCGTGKDKNKKRRVMSLEFAKRLALVMKPGSELYFASDWHELALDIRNCLLNSGYFELPDQSRPELMPTITPQQLKCAQKMDEKRFIDTRKNAVKPISESNELWLATIPYGGVMTERDVVCETQWRSVFRLVLLRNSLMEVE
jgi:tRNA (guanine-N7-)-methyltransferase